MPTSSSWVFCPRPCWTLCWATPWRNIRGRYRVNNSSSFSSLFTVPYCVLSLFHFGVPLSFCPPVLPPFFAVAFLFATFLFSSPLLSYLLLSFHLISFFLVSPLLAPPILDQYLFISSVLFLSLLLLSLHSTTYLLSSLLFCFVLFCFLPRAQDSSSEKHIDVRSEPQGQRRRYCTVPYGTVPYRTKHALTPSHSWPWPWSCIYALSCFITTLFYSFLSITPFICIVMWM